MKISKILFFSLVFILISIGGYVFVKWEEHTKAIDEIDNYLELYNYIQNIESKKAKYNIKTGDTEVTVFYKDIPSVRYKYYYNRYYKEVRGYAVDNETNVEITTEKYIP